MIEAAVIRTPAGTLAAATAADAEILRSLQAGKAYRVKVTQMSNRSYQHHKLFFGGLLPLAYEYWVPSGGLVTDGEQKLISGFARRLEAMHSGCFWSLPTSLYGWWRQSAGRESARCCKVWRLSASG